MGARKKEYPPFLSQYLLQWAAPFVIYPDRDRSVKAEARALLDNLTRQFVEWRKTFQPKHAEPEVARYLTKARAPDLDLFGQPVLLDQLYTRDLLAAVPAFVKRTQSLQKLSLAGMPKSEPVAYLREAANCFIQGLFQACVGLSRSAMELQLRGRVAELLGQQAVAALELKDLIERSRLSKQSLTDATTVRRAGNDVLHVGATDTTKALAVLEAARRVVLELSPRV